MTPPRHIPCTVRHPDTSCLWSNAFLTSLSVSLIHDPSGVRYFWPPHIRPQPLCCSHAPLYSHWIRTDVQQRRPLLSLHLPVIIHFVCGSVWNVSTGLSSSTISFQTRTVSKGESACMERKNMFWSIFFICHILDCSKNCTHGKLYITAQKQIHKK